MSVLRYLVSIGLDYIRWSQMVPMILAWAFILLALTAMTFINFQETSVSILAWLSGIWEKYEWLPSIDLSAYEQADGSIRITDELLQPAILKAWGVISLVLLVIDLLRTSFSGQREHKTLSRKLLIAAIGCAILSVGFLLNYWLSSESYDDGTTGWVTLFIGAPALVWLISAYSLSIGHLLNNINGRLIDRDNDPGRLAKY